MAKVGTDLIMVGIIGGMGIHDPFLTAIGRIPGKSSCQCGSALSGDIATSFEAIPVETCKKLAVQPKRQTMTK